MPKTKIELSELEKFCVDAYVQNGNADFAYLLSRTHKPTATPENLHRMAILWVKSERVKNYIKYRIANQIVNKAVTDGAADPNMFNGFGLNCSVCPLFNAWKPDEAAQIPEETKKLMFGDDV